MAKLYPVVLIPMSADEGGGFMAYAPDLKGCMSHGDTEEEALAGVKSAVDEWIEEANNLGKPVPEPGSGAVAARAQREALKKQFEEQRIALEKLREDVRHVEAVIQQVQAAAAVTASNDRGDVLWTTYVAASAVARDKVPDDVLH